MPLNAHFHTLKLVWCAAWVSQSTSQDVRVVNLLKLLNMKNGLGAVHDANARAVSLLQKLWSKTHQILGRWPLMYLIKQSKQTNKHPFPLRVQSLLLCLKTPCHLHASEQNSPSIIWASLVKVIEIDLSKVLVITIWARRIYMLLKFTETLQDSPLCPS